MNKTVNLNNIKWDILSRNIEAYLRYKLKRGDGFYGNTKEIIEDLKQETFMSFIKYMHTLKSIPPLEEQIKIILRQSYWALSAFIKKACNQNLYFKLEPYHIINNEGEEVLKEEVAEKLATEINLGYFNLRLEERKREEEFKKKIHKRNLRRKIALTKRGILTD